MSRLQVQLALGLFDCNGCWVDRRDQILGGPRGGLPEAKHRGVLRILDTELPCYVLSDGLGRTSVTEMLTGIKGGGALEKYLGVNALKPFIDLDLVLERMVPFALPEVEGGQT